jgi:hypothetical protein
MNSVRGSSLRSSGVQLKNVSTSTRVSTPNRRFFNTSRIGALLFSLLVVIGITTAYAKSDARLFRDKGAKSFINAVPQCRQEGGFARNHVVPLSNVTKVIHVDRAVDTEGFRNFILGTEHEFPDLPVFVYFTAEKCNGVSWCGDSNRAEPIVLSAIEKYRPNCVFIVCAVKRSEYHSSKNKRYSMIALDSVPTLQR